MQQQSGTAKPVKTIQTSIQSFLQPRTPRYTAPPVSTTSASSSNGAQTQTVPQSPAISSISHPALPSQATISTIQEHHIQPLRRINSLLLPVAYPDNFYHRLLAPGESQPIFSRIILWQDGPSKSKPGGSESKIIGGVVCRIDPDEGSDTSSIYIQSLALLSPYRSYGLATTVLEDIITNATLAAPSDTKITSLYAHVWTQNEEALEWYAKRGFTKEEPILHGYYRRLKPDTAWVVRRVLRTSDHLRQSRPDTTSGTMLAESSTTDISRGQAPPASPRGPLRPNPLAGVRAASYQSMRPATEWNDLPSDILSPSRSNTPSLKPSPNSSTTNLLEPPISGEDRSSSQTRGGKKKRQYPTAAFGAPHN